METVVLGVLEEVWVFESTGLNQMLTHITEFYHLIDGK